MPDQTGQEVWLDMRGAQPGKSGARSLERFANTLQSEGLQYDGDRWQCPSCRSQDRELDFVLQVQLVGNQVELSCDNDCRPNTIRALLGAPPYFPNVQRRKMAANFPYR